MTTRMFAEAAESHDAVARQLVVNRDALRALAESLRADPPRAVATCARGSSDHAATYLKHLVETRVGLLVTSISPSVASLYDVRPAMAGALAIGLSQSGKSPDLVAAMRAAHDGGARTLAMVNVIGSPLAEDADAVLPLHAGPEVSVAATKSFLALLAAAASLTAAWAEDVRLQRAVETLPDLLARAWECDWAALPDALAGARGLYVIGRGPGFGAAQEAALKLKETCGLQAEAFSAAEVRHGPMALIGAELPLLVFRQDDASADGIDTLVADAVARGATVLVASDKPPVAGATHLPLPGAHPALAPVAAVQAFYRAANALSLARGFDPDRPPHLKKVTETV